MERYEILKDIGSGNFGVAKLVRDKWSGELYAVKYIERGQKIDEHVQREIMNHRSLKHPNIVRFKESWNMLLEESFLREYVMPVDFSEDEARYFFQQLIYRSQLLPLHANLPPRSKAGKIHS
uniref:Protein kinase domain-containing protein n=1 Tax=Vitis vinifera TaxID=29760 RepID=A5BN65_VITVI|nr:hypothetical protein VITISV_029721 [Vitis vinifera]